MSAGSSSLYAAPNDPVSLAEGICRLLDNPDLRAEMGAGGRERFNEELAWSQQVFKLISAYDDAMSRSHLDINLRRAEWWRRGLARRYLDEAVPQSSCPSRNLLPDSRQHKPHR